MIGVPHYSALFVFEALCEVRKLFLAPAVHGVLR